MRIPKGYKKINRRRAGYKYYPELFKLIDDAFKASKWRYVRYDKRNAPRANDAQ
jgi:hypothetical protein